MRDLLLGALMLAGVTTVMFGNCGVGFAPVKKHRAALMDLMEGVEEIPNPVLAAGLELGVGELPISWMSWSAAARHRHLRKAGRASAAAGLCVMGDRAIRREPATPDDIAERCAASPSRRCAPAPSASPPRAPILHKTPDGELVPSRDADADELVGDRLRARRGRRGRFRHEQRFRRRGVWSWPG
jgi:hypothetical protein